jgi:hypothetical protein
MSLALLKCRGCGRDREITIPDGVTRPQNFLCRDCTAGRSMTDGRSVADVQNTELAGRVLREGRADNVVESEPGESAIERWRRLNPEWHRVYRQLHRAGYRRPKRTDHPPASVMIAQWYEQVARFDWRCSECRAELTREMVCCSRSDCQRSFHSSAVRTIETSTPPESGRTFRLEDCVPLCPRCAKRRAANARWKNNRPDAEGNDLFIGEGKECTATPPS